MKRVVVEVAGTYRVVVDVVVLALREEALCVLVQDARLPGGPVGAQEDLPAAAQRFLAQLCSPELTWPLDQVGAYGIEAGTVRLAFRVLCPPTTQAGNGQWRPVAEIDKPAVDDALDQLAEDICFTTVAAALCPGLFTAADLRRVYEEAWAAPLDSGNFHRLVQKNPEAWVATGGRRRGTGGRAAALYRRGAHRLASPVLRPVSTKTTRYPS